MLQNQLASATLVVKNHKIVCPFCRRLTQQVVRSDTEARNLQVFCRGCKAEFVVNIENGQCSSSPCR